MSKSELVRFSCAALGQRFTERKMVGLIGLEPMTPALSRRCSNQLSYRPGVGKVETSKAENRNLVSAFRFPLSAFSSGGG